MMDTEALAAHLAKALDGTDIGLLELRTPQGTLRLRRDGSKVVATTASHITVAASSVGVFRHGHPLRAAPLAPPGTRVRAGDPLGLLRIGALLIAVVAPRDGVVDRMLAADGALVGYGAPLARLRVDPEPPPPARQP
jgi:acetyl-CoA carboxylase biotin carboxyl carrier protein